MNPASVTSLAAWLTEAGLASKNEALILDGFCRRAVAAGLPLSRAIVVVDTLHPVHEGRAVRWRSEGEAGQTEVSEYGPTNEGEAAEVWHRSPFFHLVESGAPRLRICLAAGETTEFPGVVELQEEGMTDYLAIITRFAADGVIGEMDCVYSSWVTDHPCGFDDGQVEALIGLVPMLALAVKCVSLGRIAGTLVETYLGRDAGRRVLGGLIRRGVVETISAVLWYSDLREFTRITDRAAPQQIIALLNDYAEAVISAVYDNGGDVLKLIGDGALAIFTAETNTEACRHALAAHAAMRDRLDALEDRRAAERLPITEVYLGLHVGDVSYGNIGSKDRLDFTVIGGAVNEVSRIAAMCRSAERNVLVSAAFAAAAAEADRTRLVSVGRYALRGVERPQELFTIDALATG
jgi:adenylate cyclase